LFKLINEYHSHKIAYCISFSPKYISSSPNLFISIGFLINDAFMI